MTVLLQLICNSARLLAIITAGHAGAPFVFTRLRYSQNGTSGLLAAVNSNVKCCWPQHWGI